jgi:hypothetical protein
MRSSSWRGRSYRPASPQRTGCCHLTSSGWSVNCGPTSRAAGWRSRRCSMQSRCRTWRAQRVGSRGRVPLGPPARRHPQRGFKRAQDGDRIDPRPRSPLVATAARRQGRGRRAPGSRRSRGYRSVDRTLGACRRYASELAVSEVTLRAIPSCSNISIPERISWSRVCAAARRRTDRFGGAVLR